MKLRSEELYELEPYIQLKEVRAALNIFSLSFGNADSIAYPEDNILAMSLIQEKLKKVISFLEDDRVRIEIDGSNT